MYAPSPDWCEQGSKQAVGWVPTHRVHRRPRRLGGFHPPYSPKSPTSSVPDHSGSTRPSRMSRWIDECGQSTGPRHQPVLDRVAPTIPDMRRRNRARRGCGAPNTAAARSRAPACAAVGRASARPSAPNRTTGSSAGREYLGDAGEDAGLKPGLPPASPSVSSSSNNDRVNRALMALHRAE